MNKLFNKILNSKEFKKTLLMLLFAFVILGGLSLVSAEGSIGVFKQNRWQFCIWRI